MNEKLFAFRIKITSNNNAEAIYEVKARNIDEAEMLISDGEYYNIELLTIEDVTNTKSIEVISQTEITDETVINDFIEFYNETYC